MFVEDKGGKTDKWELAAQAASNFATKGENCYRSYKLSDFVLCEQTDVNVWFFFLKNQTLKKNGFSVKLWDVLFDSLYSSFIIILNTGYIDKLSISIYSFSSRQDLM